MDNQETVKEFNSENPITLKVKVSPEEYRLINEWSLSIPTLYMLDICVVSITKLTRSSLENNLRKENLVNHLRELDRPNNSFSYLFALMEKVSDSRGIDTAEELENKILSDLFALRNFFKNASVFESDDFVLNFLRALRGSPIEERRPVYLDFLHALNNQFNLTNPVSSKQRLGVANKIIKKADELNFARQHPVVTIGLACLYGNPAAKKLMKFKADPQKFDAENVLADIMLITRFAGIKLEVEKIGRSGHSKYQRVIFITDDNGLIEILKCFTPDLVRHTDKHDGRETQITMTVKLKDLLTDIPNEEYDHLIELLSKTA